MSTAADKANLARIRDNQRRSRARRKEYLQELEHKLRVCELQGVEASSEIQQAARKVADENRRLRGLLNKQGVSDEIIESYLQSGGSQSADSQYRSVTGQVVHQLEDLLQPRRPACLDPNTPFPPMSAAVRGREGSIISIPSHQPNWDTSSTTSSMTARGMPPLPRVSPPHQHYVTTPTTTSASMPRSETAYAHHGGLNSILEDPRHANRSPMSSHGHGDGGHSSAHGGLPYEVSSSMAHAHHQGYSHHLPSHAGPTGQQHSHSYASSSSACCPPARRGSHASTLPSSSGYLPSSTPVSSAGSDSTNCQQAAVIISSMTGHDQSNVRGGLGCAPTMDCHVDHPTFARPLDRYSSVPTTGPPMSM